MGLLGRLLGRGGSPARDFPVHDGSILVNAYATVRDLPPPDFPHAALETRDLSGPGLEEHLKGFVGYVMSRGEGRMTGPRYQLWRHVQRVRNQASFRVFEPDLPAIEAWALDACAILYFPDGSVRAPDTRLLLSAEGASDPAAVLPYQPDAVARRVRSLAALSDMDPRPAASMPPAIGERELLLRPPRDVLDRALGLFFVAARAQYRHTGRGPIPAGRSGDNPTGSARLTPKEREYLAAGDADPKRDLAMTWRYEAANVLLWALGFDVASIASPDRMIDVDALWQSVANTARLSAGEPAPPLRPAGEILDALDRTWREHWIVREAIQRGYILRGLDADIVMERHHALNWLTGFQNEIGTDWDGIDTPS